MDIAACEACRTQLKNWQGDDPKCSFPNGGAFDGAGWNCATAGMIRDLVYEGEPHQLVDYRYCDDMKYATVKIDHLHIDGAMALWVAWYKSRGRTDAMWLLFADAPPRRPTAAECVQIASYCREVK